MTTRLNGTQFETLNQPVQRPVSRETQLTNARILSRRIARAARRSTRAI